MTNNHDVAFCISGDVLVTLASTALSFKQKHKPQQSQIDKKIGIFINNTETQLLGHLTRQP
jgi:hypothetical protein